MPIETSDMSPSFERRRSGQFDRAAHRARCHIALIRSRARMPRPASRKMLIFLARLAAAGAYMQEVSFIFERRRLLLRHHALLTYHST